MAGSKRTPKAQKEVAQRVADAVVTVGRHLRTVKLPEGMTPERLASLALIKDHQPVSVSELAALAKVKVPTISRMISSLSADGLVSRQGHEADGRGVMLSLTPKGRRAYVSANQRALARLEQAVARLSRDEVAALTAVAEALKSLDDEASAA